MAEKVRSVMTSDPVSLPDTASCAEAARAMRESDIGDVVVTKDGKLCGIVTDRDIVVRAIAMGKNPEEIQLSDLCSKELITCGPEDSVDHAIQLMRERAIRRLIVTEGERPVGVVSLGDLALDRDRHSVLGQISAAPANH
ncbi:MAG: CBS domain-containing protein [Chloroflexi bacterium]|nr:CBS domain-containing protein [Chloroflexota bacterium]